MKIEVLKKDSSKGLRFLEGINRPVVPSHVSKIADSITKIGVIRPIITAKLSFISGKKEEYIIDGQHLYHACIRCGVDIPKVEIQIRDEKELVERIALLNASSKSWSLMDYVKSWAFINSDYKFFEKMYNTYDLDARVIIKCCMGIATGASTLKKGNFTVNNKTASIAILDKVTDVLNVLPRGNRMGNREFCMCYIDFINNPRYNHAKFVKYVKDNTDKLIFVTQDVESLKRFIEKGL